MLTILGEAERAEYSAHVDNNWFRQTLRVEISPKRHRNGMQSILYNEVENQKKKKRQADCVWHTAFGYWISTGQGRQAEKLSREIWDSGWILQQRQVPTVPTVLLDKSISGRETGSPVVQASATTNQSWRFLGNRGALPISRQENVGASVPPIRKPRAVVITGGLK